MYKIIGVGKVRRDVVKPIPKYGGKKDTWEGPEFVLCDFCGAQCRVKTIGNICMGCITSVPIHIPNEQIVKYLRKTKKLYHIQIK